MRAFAQEPREAHQAKIAKSVMPQRPGSLQGGAADCILDLQRTSGNQAVQRLFQAHRASIEVDPTTATVDAPGDAYEQEADRIADQVVAMPTHSAGRSAPSRLQRFSGQSTGQLDTAPGSVDQTLASVGRPLEAELRQDMEQRLGHDFSQVRVHSGAMAEQSARDVNANAYTVGHGIVFGAGQFAPRTREGRRLIAHELTHVVQQSRSQSPSSAATRPSLMQRKKYPARASVEKAMNKLREKFGLAGVTEEHGATWSESELAKVDAAFSKVSNEDRPLLMGLHLIRTDKFDPLTRSGKTFDIAGETFGTGTIELDARAFRGDAYTILHEVGHLILNKAAKAILEKSEAKSDLDTAQHMMGRGVTLPGLEGGREYKDALTKLGDAATALRDSGDDDRAAKQSALDDAIAQADMFRPVARKDDKVVAAWLEYHDRLEKWVEAVKEYVKEEGAKKNLADFIDVVTKNNLARKGYTPFNDYVAANWPAHPEEFFAQSFSMWRNNPNYMKMYMKPLFLWFEKAGYREGRNLIERTAPVIYELGKEAKETFWPKDVQDAIPLPLRSWPRGR